MSDTHSETRSVVVERELPFPAEKVWRALTQPHLIEEWLMKNDFVPATDHSFSLRGNWGAVDCRVLEIEPLRTLSYTWVARDLDSVVTWTLTPTGAGTRLRVEQVGFRRNQSQYYGGARTGWPKLLEALEQVLSQMA